MFWKPRKKQNKADIFLLKRPVCHEGLLTRQEKVFLLPTSKPLLSVTVCCEEEGIGVCPLPVFI